MPQKRKKFKLGDHFSNFDFISKYNLKRYSNPKISNEFDKKISLMLPKSFKSAITSETNFIKFYEDISPEMEMSEFYNLLCDDVINDISTKISKKELYFKAKKSGKRYSKKKYAFLINNMICDNYVNVLGSVIADKPKWYLEDYASDKHCLAETAYLKQIRKYFFPSLIPKDSSRSYKLSTKIQSIDFNKNNLKHKKVKK